MPRTHRAPHFEFACDATGQLRLSGNGGGVIGDGEFFINDQLIGEALLRSIPPELADLLDVAVAVYLADRLARRAGNDGNQYEHHWQRSMHVTVPVRNPDRWTDPATKLALCDALVFLTEDEWTLDFTKRSPGHSRPSEEVGFLFEHALKQPVRVALFSGGLDSLAGIVDDLAADPEGSMILVSANTSKRILPVQRSLIEALRAQTGRQIEWAVVHFGMRKRRKKQYESEERSQRTRGFAFAVAGAVVSLLVESERLRLYENGVGAINLPYTNWQLGAQNTRAMHPAAISLIEDALRRVSTRTFCLDLPNLFRTKGDLCGSLAQSPLASLATRTISCDGYPLRVPGAKQCGLCSSCLLRRQALHASGIADRQGGIFGYQRDVYADVANIPAEKRFPLEAMLDQARRIRHALGVNNSWAGLRQEFPTLVELPETLSSGAQAERLALMYGRYADETFDFADALAKRRVQKAGAS
jgi:hypothetical protein